VQNQIFSKRQNLLASREWFRRPFVVRTVQSNDIEKPRGFYLVTQIDTNLGVIGQIITAIDKSYTGFTLVIDAFNTSAKTAKSQLQAEGSLTRFQLPAWKTKVISIPKTFDAMEALWQQIRSTLLADFAACVSTVQTVVDAIKAIPPPGPNEPVLQYTALVLNTIYAGNSELSDEITQLLDLSTILTMIGAQLGVLDAFFLSQSKPRKKSSVTYSKRGGQTGGS
jgi:hypothetical protein